MRLAFLLSFLALLVATPSFAQAPAASPFEEPILAFFDSQGAQFGDFAQSGNAVFLRPNGKAIFVPTNGQGFLPGVPLVQGGYIHYDDVNCTGNAALGTGPQGGSVWNLPDADLLAFIAGSVSPQKFVVFDAHNYRAWEIESTLVRLSEFQSVSYLDYSVSIGNSHYGQCKTTLPGLPAVVFAGMNWVQEVTHLFTGFVPPFTLQPIPE